MARSEARGGDGVAPTLHSPGSERPGATHQAGATSWCKARAQQSLQRGVGCQLIAQEVGHLASWPLGLSQKGNTPGPPLKVPRREHLPSSKKMAAESGSPGSASPQRLIDWSRDDQTRALSKAPGWI